jgi:TM2 domain-containing membrane protein YozV
MALVSCSECGKQISEKAAACPGCGMPMAGNVGVNANNVTVSIQKSRGVAVVLALFLGGVGAHKFYVGQLGWGVVYILFCWTFIPAIVGFIEALSYISMSESQFQKHCAS